MSIDPLNDPSANPASVTRARRAWGLAFAAAALLYGLTANRYVQWQDSGWQQARIVSGMIGHPRGLVLTHPLEYFIGRAALCLPLEPAHAITLAVGALPAAIAAANLAAILVLLTRRRLSAVLIVPAYALAHTVWLHATHTESYSLVAALLTTEWLALAIFAREGKGRWLILALAANGLGVSNHVLALLATPVDLSVLVWAFQTRRVPRWSVVVACVVWWLAAMPYVVLIGLDISHGAGFAAALVSALFGKFRAEVLNVAINPRLLVLSMGFVVYNYPGLVIPLAILGIWTERSRSVLPRWLARVWLCELVLYTVFVLRYSIDDQFTFFGPVYALLAIFAGIGVCSVLRWNGPAWRRVVLVATAATALWPPLVYAATAYTLTQTGALRGMLGNRPYRNGARVLLCPWGVGDDHVARITGDALHLAGSNGLILLRSNMAQYAFQYERALGRVPQDVTVYTVKEMLRDWDDDRRRGFLREAVDEPRPVVLVPEDRDRPDTYAPGARWSRHGDLYVLVGLDP